MSTLNLDQILNLIAQFGWAIFAVYAIAIFVYSVRTQGFIIAIIRLLSVRVLLPLLLTIAVSFLSMALVFVEPQYVGVVVSMVSPGGIRSQPMRPGLHWILPFVETEVKYPIYWQTYTMSNKINEGTIKGDDSIRARTSDGQEVRLDSSVIFQIDTEQAVSVHIDWQDRYIEDFIRPVIRGFVRTQVSQFSAKAVNSSKRKDLEITLESLLREEFLDKGIIIDQFLLRDVTFTPEYIAAIEQKQVALEGIEKTESQATQIRNLAIGERDRLKLEAEGRAEAVRLEAKARAEAHLIEGQAEADVLQLLSVIIAQNQNVLTYNYINKLSPNIRVMLVPSESPLILSLPELDEEGNPISNTVISSTQTSAITQTLPITPTIELNTP